MTRAQQVKSVLGMGLSDVRGSLTELVNDVFEDVDKTMQRIRKRVRRSVADAEHQPHIELNAPVPDFTATTTHGEIQLSQWERDKWVILFAHPADFTPVCTTEMIAFARSAESLRQRNVALLGSSVDSVYSHIAWLRNIEDKFDTKVDFPVIADVDMNVARLYGMIQSAESEVAAVRAVFFIDPDRRLRATIYYPMNVGRSLEEINRVIDALQAADKQDAACPADWHFGDALVLPPPATLAEAAKRMAENGKTKGVTTTDWYFGRRAS